MFLSTNDDSCCSRYRLTFVDPLVSAEFVATVAESSDCSSRSLAVVLRNELIASLKGYANAPDELAQHLSDALLKTVSADLLRRCIAFRLDADASCRVRGFVLDAWTATPGTCFSCAADLRTILERPESSPEFNESYNASPTLSVIELLVIRDVFLC